MKFEDKKLRNQYPMIGKQYNINLANEFFEADTKGKFIVFLQDGATLELWESQLDAMLPLGAQQKYKGVLKIIFEDYGTNGKTKLMPKKITEEL